MKILGAVWFATWFSSLVTIALAMLCWVGYLWIVILLANPITTMIITCLAIIFTVVLVTELDDAGII